MEPLPQVKGQLTLFDLGKVVSSKGKTWGAFSEADLAAHRAALLDPASSKELLLNTLRKLDCYRLCAPDLGKAELGSAVATLANHHPREEVARLAGALVIKWQEMCGVQWEGRDLFRAAAGYDAAAAAAAPVGDFEDFKLHAPPPPPPEAPPPQPQPTRIQPARKEKAQRLKEEEAYLEGSDEEDPISESSSESEGEGDEEWKPGMRRKGARKSGGTGKGRPASPPFDPRQRKLCWGALRAPAAANGAPAAAPAPAEAQPAPEAAAAAAAAAVAEPVEEAAGLPVEQQAAAAPPAPLPEVEMAIEAAAPAAAPIIEEEAAPPIAVHGPAVEAATVPAAPAPDPPAAAPAAAAPAAGSILAYFKRAAQPKAA